MTSRQKYLSHNNGIIKIKFLLHLLTKKVRSHTEKPQTLHMNNANIVKICMAYNKSNYYKKIIKIQEITQMQKHQHGLTYKEIYYKHIEEQFNISSRTYRTYLGIPAKRELKKLQEAERLKGQQLTFNF